MPEPAAGEILVEVEACGVCRTDLHVAEGDLPVRRPNVVPGHEIVGRVVARGESGITPREGARVGVAWLHRGCGRCRFCARGAENLCLAPRFTGWDADGGGNEVFVVSRGERHQQLARDLGADWVGGPGGRPPEPLDAAILFAPAGAIVPDALAALDRGGVLAVAGIHLSEIPPLDYQRHLFQERVLRSVTANTRADGRALLRLAQEIPIRTHVERYPLTGALDALRDLATDRIRGAAVLEVGPARA